MLKRYMHPCEFPNEAFVQQAIEAYFVSAGFEHHTDSVRVVAPDDELTGNRRVRQARRPDARNEGTMRLYLHHILKPLYDGDPSHVWLRAVDEQTVSFTLESGEFAHLYMVEISTGVCSLALSLERPVPTGKVWKSCEMLVSQGRTYALLRHELHRYGVRDLASDREVALPILPAPESRVDTVADFWANADRVVYLNEATHLTGRAMVVACDWYGNVRWTVGVDDAFPQTYLYLWEAALCAQSDGSFLVFFNGNAFGEDELWVGCLWISPDGELQQALQLPWSAVAPDDHIDGGGAFLLDGRPHLVAHLQQSTIVRGLEGETLVLPEFGEAGPLTFTGIAPLGDRVVVAVSGGGLAVLQAIQTSGAEPTLHQLDRRTGLEPTI